MGKYSQVADSVKVEYEYPFAQAKKLAANKVKFIIENAEQTTYNNDDQWQFKAHTANGKKVATGYNEKVEGEPGDDVEVLERPLYADKFIVRLKADTSRNALFEALEEDGFPEDTVFHFEGEKYLKLVDD